MLGMVAPKLGAAAQAALIELEPASAPSIRGERLVGRVG
jgi:hypothetical protein